MAGVSSSAEKDVKMQYCEAWAKSWSQLQEEQLNACMECIHKCFVQQRSSMEAVMQHSSDMQQRHMQRFFEESDKWNGSIPSFPFSANSKSHENIKPKFLFNSTSNLSKAVTQTTLDDQTMLGKAEQETIGKKIHAHANTFEREAASATEFLEINPEDTIDNRISHDRRLKGMLQSVRRAVGWQDALHIIPAHLMHTSVEFRTPQVETTDDLQAHCVKIVRNPFFELVAALVVIANTLVIAIESDNELKSALKTGSHEAIFPDWLNILFTSLFCLELFCRIVAFRSLFFHRHQRLWNAFDIFVVASAVVELLFQTINLSFIRLLRVLRMLRVLRVIRVLRQFRELRVMLSSIITSIVTLAWTLVLLTLVIFLFAIVLMQGASSYIRDETDRSGSIPAHIRTDLETHFPDMRDSMYTLLTTISGGQDWVRIGNMWENIYWGYFWCFIFYQCFVIFGVLNVLTGVFVESAGNIARVDKELVLTTEMERRESFLNQIESLFVELDKDRSGTIEWDEFNNHLEDPRVLLYFSELDMDVTEAKGLFQLLDINEKGSIAIEEFVLGCMRLRGMAKSIDIATMLYESKKQSLHNENQFEGLRAAVKSLKQHVKQNTVALQKNTHHLASLDLQVTRNASLARQNAALLQDDATHHGGIIEGSNLDPKVTREVTREVVATREVTREVVASREVAARQVDRNASLARHNETLLQEFLGMRT